VAFLIEQRKSGNLFFLAADAPSPFVAEVPAACQHFFIFLEFLVLEQLDGN
jgi:hypothetical protein